MNRYRLLAAASAFAACTAPVAQAAPVVNGGFEGGMTSWTTLGDAVVVGGYAPAAPEGLAALLLTTAATLDEPAWNASGLDPALVGTPDGVESFAGVPLGALDPDPLNVVAAYEGSAARQTVQLAAGDTLTLNWNLLTSDSLPGDFAFVTLGGELFRLGGNEDATLTLPSGSTFERQGGWHTFSYTASQSRTIDLAIGIVDVGDYSGPSALLVDDVVVTAVPEPHAFGLGALGLLGIAATRRRASR